MNRAGRAAIAAVPAHVLWVATFSSAIEPLTRTLFFACFIAIPLWPAAHWWRERRRARS
jgi:hypothetical protein